MSRYLQYYDAQIGGGFGLRGGVYSESRFQRGHGIGSFLGGLARMIIPCLKTGAKVVGKEALRTGLNIMNDVENNGDFNRALETRVKESGRRLKRKASSKLLDMMGDGYKTYAPKRRRQSKKKRGGVRNSGAIRKKRVKKNSKRGKKNTKKKNTKKRKTLRSITDIFGPGVN